LADDHQIMREGLKSLLAGEKGLDVVGEASDGRDAVELTEALRPDVVVMDIGMPGLGGIEATRRIRAETPGARVLALSMHRDRRFIAGMFGAGASGYLLKDAAYEELVCAVRAVDAGKTYLSSGIQDLVVADYAERLREVDSTPGGALTDREREVVQLLAEGVSAKETAARLGISVKTVETHRQHAMEKVGVRSVAELTKYAIREGLTSLER